MLHEEAIVFDCEGDKLVGILHHPEQTPTTGILMIVGGPQYRIGSHRQFVEFARAQSLRGCAVMRFDYRGMGDSSGPFLNFEKVQADIQCALDEFTSRVPSVKSVVFFGLCDGAAASLIHVPDDPKIDGLMLLNPWVRNAKTKAKAVVKNYYRERFFGSEFWKKVFTGKADITGSLISFVSNVKRSLAKADDKPLDFRAGMLAGAQRFSGKVLVILSEKDLTANEFLELIKQSPEWTSVSSTSDWTWRSLPTANHTFADCKEKQQVIDLCSEWMDDL